MRNSSTCIPASRRLYWRIWLAAAGSVAVLSVLVGWAWRVAEQARENQQPPPREVMLRNAEGALIGTAQIQQRHSHGQPLEMSITLQNGQVLNLQVPPRKPAADGHGPGARLRQPARPPETLPALLRPPWGFWWMMALAGLAVMIGVFPVARRLTQRLETLQRGVQRWGEGDLSARVPEGGQDEVADLSRHFNAAASRIESLMDSQAALLQSQKSLLANASHELRSPLARIRMALELMPASAAAHASRAQATRQEIDRNIAELDQLIDEILLASRLDAREADMGAIEPVDMTGLLAEECARTGAELHVAQGAAAITVPGVAKLLRRAVRNLLENAVRHSGSAAVQASLAIDGAQALLHVDDHGPGVPEAQRERIFEPFYRLPGASEREGGVGLGLALVRSIAQRHHGSVQCGTHASGGARFTLRLPLA